jgi:hypothetical protein
MVKTYPYPLSDAFLRKRLSFALFRPFDVQDAGGRPLMEGRSVVHALPSDDLRACRYDDSRADNERPMNVGALAAFRSNRIALHDFIARVAGAINADQACGAPEPSLGDLWRFAMVCRAAPLADLLRAFLTDAQMPVAECGMATAHKVALGIVDTILHAVEHNHSLDERWSPTSFYEFADEHERLTGRKEVCAAPRGLIVGFMSEVMTELSAGPAHARIAQPEPRWSSLRIARLQWSLHRASLIFDTVQYTIWYRRQQAARTSDELHPKPRRTTPYFDLALSLAHSRDPFASSVFRFFVEHRWYDVEPLAYQTCLTKFTDAAKVVLEEEGSSEAQWSAFVDTAADLLHACDREIVEILDARDWGVPHAYGTQDISHFFGPAPYSVAPVAHATR